MRVHIAAGLIVLTLALAGCGGGDDGGAAPPPPPPPPASNPDPVIGAAGGTVTETTGASIVIPPGAFDANTTVRIARDSTGAPAVPAGLSSPGSIYVITPHGGDFAEPVEVILPAPNVTLQPNQLFKIAKAQPGEGWLVLDDTVLVDGKLKAKVTSFSFFMTVIVTYTLPIAQFEPFTVTPSVNCGEQDCVNALGPMNVTYTATGNNGQLPESCPNDALYVQHGEGNNVSGGPGSSRFVTQQLPHAGGSFSLLVPTNWLFQYSFAVGMRCNGWWSTLGWTLNRSVKWAAPPTFPEISIARVPAQLDVVEGMPANLEAILFGGAGNGRGLAFVPATVTNRAVIDWQRSDDGGRSWRDIAHSYENEANPFPFGTGVSFRPWSVSHGFIATAMDQGALLRVHACYTPPPATPAPPCTYSTSTLINVLQQSSLPAIVTAPRSVLVRTGQTASLSVTSTGSPLPTIQWQTRAANSNGAWGNVTTGTGATSSNYVTGETSIADNGAQYRVLLTNAVGSTASMAVTVSVSEVDVAPSITTQPASLNTASGSDAVFAVDARGTEALSYQWLRNGVAIAGANSPILRLTAVNILNSGSFTVTVSNAAGDADSNAAILNVYPGTPAAAAPTIVTQPANLSVNVGNTATFAVGVDGSGPFTFQWRKDGASIPGATSAVLALPSVVSGTAGSYSVVVSNSVGPAVTSTAATLSVSSIAAPEAPNIVTQPSTIVVPVGGSAVLAVAASGSGPLSYQWARDGVPISGATAAVLTFTSVIPANAADFSVTVSNPLGSAVSQAATLILLGAPVIYTAPSSVAVFENSTTTFRVDTGGSNLHYQWLRNGSPISSSDSDAYTTPSLTVADSGAVYSVIVFNGAGLVVSGPAVLTVTVPIPPTVLQQPADVSVVAGLPANLCMAFGGTPPFSVQMNRWSGVEWTPTSGRFPVNDNGTICASTPNLQLADNGALFMFLASNAEGGLFEAMTRTVTVTVTAPAGTTATTLVSRALTGGPPDNLSDQPSISADGRYVAFVSIGTNLVSGAVRNGNAYVRDLQTGVTRLINVNLDGDESEMAVHNVKLSSNGRYAIFSTRAGDLVPGDTNTSVDIFRRDLLTNTTIRLSVLPNGDELENGVSGGGNADMQVDISADGQGVIFLSAYDITGNSSNNGYYYLYHRDLQTGFTRAIAGSSEYQVAYSALSDDGLYIAYAMGVSNGTQSIQLYDVEASSEISVFNFNASVSPDGLRQGMSVSNDGRYVAFAIHAPTLLGSPYDQVIVADRNTNTYAVASVNLGVAGNGNSAWPEISGDGRYVMFSSIAPSLTNNLATSFTPYVVLRDLVEGNTAVASVRSNGTEASAGLFVNDQHALSEDGSTLAFVADYYVMAGQQFGNQVFATGRPN